MENNQLKNILIKIGEVNPKYDLEKQVYNKGKLIQFIDDPSQELQLAAVKKNPFSIEYIQNPTEKVQLAAVNKWGNAIYYIQNPSETVQLAAVKDDPDSIKYIQNPTEKVIQLARSKGVNI